MLDLSTELCIGLGAIRKKERYRGVFVFVFWSFDDFSFCVSVGIFLNDTGNNSVTIHILLRENLESITVKLFQRRYDLCDRTYLVCPQKRQVLSHGDKTLQAWGKNL